MKNKSRNLLLMSFVLAFAFAAFAFTAPNVANKTNIQENISMESMSMNNSFPADLTTAKCGAANEKTVKTEKKTEQAKCGSKDAKAAKMAKKTGNAKCGSKDAKTGKKAVKGKKAEGKCGQGKCGVS